jgi:nicotinamidase-related amidase
LIPELTGLPFFAESVVIPKRSLNVGLEPAFEDWLRDHPQTSTWIVVGDCTDLCVYHAAMHLRMRANVHQLDLEVIVPAALVETYDLPVGVAVGLGALPHAGDFLGRAFLYHMALNGIRVVREVTV